MTTIRSIQLILVLICLMLVGCGAPFATESAVEIEDASTTTTISSESETSTALATNDAPENDNSAEIATSTTLNTSNSTDTDDEIVRPEGWSEATHSNDADPNYEVVFPDNEVNAMTITIDPEDWQAMLDDMTALYGSSGQRSRGMADSSVENPMWVAATIEFEGDTWTDVGVRFKGNSSLHGVWSSGSLELPFKLDFDQYEDENPAIDDQRFYGFKQLSLSNNYKDDSFMRDTVTSDILAEAGIASAETAYYELFVDYGDGPVSFGLYTMIEVIDDTVIDRVFGDDDGNIYEADGTAVSLATGTFDGISTSFLKENNEDEADWSDIEALYTILHSDTRQTDPAAWKAELESIFDVDTFLKWLAINTVIENWDTYGAMTHNFYLYNNPETGQLTWIPWDHNEAINEGQRSSMTLSMDAIGDEWPLISYLLDDDAYYVTYVNYVDETINTVFVADEMVATYQEIASLIEPYASEEIGSAAFTQSVQDLIDHTYERVAAAESFVAQEKQ